MLSNRCLDVCVVQSVCDRRLYIYLFGTATRSSVLLLFPSVNDHNSSKNRFRIYHVQTSTLHFIHFNSLLIPQFCEEVSLFTAIGQMTKLSVEEVT